MQILKVFLPDFDKERRDAKLSVDEMRAQLKEKGIAPTRSWNEKPMFIDSSGTLIINTISLKIFLVKCTFNLSRKL